MTDVQHRELAAGRWWELPITEQLGHVGSEISRATRWASRNPETARAALYRALELLDLTLADPRLRASPARLREIARAREVVVDFFDGPNRVPLDRAVAAEVLDAFALARRSERPTVSRAGHRAWPARQADPARRGASALRLPWPYCSVTCVAGAPEGLEVPLEGDAVDGEAQRGRIARDRRREVAGLERDRAPVALWRRLLGRRR